MHPPYKPSIVVHTNPTIEHGHGLNFPNNVGPNSPTQPFRALWPPSNRHNDRANYNFLSTELGDSLPGYYPQGLFNAEFLDAAGGLMIQNLFGSSSEDWPQDGSWMPG